MSNSNPVEVSSPADYRENPRDMRDKLYFSILKHYTGWSVIRIK